MYVRPDPLQRHVLLHDLQDVGLKAEVVDERAARKERPLLVLQLHDRDAAAALFRRRGAESRDQRMLLQEPGQRALQLARPVSVDQPDRPLIAQAATRRETARRARSLRRRCSRSTFRSAGAVARLQLDAHVDAATAPRPRRRRRAGRGRSRACACRARRGRPCRRAPPSRPPSSPSRRRSRDRRPTGACCGGSAGARTASTGSANSLDDRVDGRRASARSRAGVAGASAGARASCAIASRLGLQLGDDVVDLAARLRAPGSRAPRSAAGGRFPRAGAAPRRAARIRASAASSVSRSRAASRCSCSSARMSLVDLRQVLGELRLARAQVLPRRGDDRRIEAEPRRDLERQAAARRAVHAADRSARTSRRRSRTPRSPRPRSSTRRS